MVGVYSIENLEEAVGIYQELGDKINAKNLYGVLGNFYKGTREYDKAVLKFEKGLALAKEIQDNQEIETFQKQIKETQNLKIFQKADTIFAEAVALTKQGKKEAFQSAIVKFEESRQLLNSIGVKKNEANCLFWIANIYLSLGETQKSLDFQNQSLTLRRQIDDKIGEALSLNNLGLLYSILGVGKKLWNISLILCN